MKSRYVEVPDSDNVVRYVPPNRQKKHPVTGQTEGILWSAFQPRQNPDTGNIESGVSVYWMERHHGTKEERQLKAVQDHSRNYKPAKTAVYAIGNVENIKHICQQFGQQVRVMYDPRFEGDTHSEIRQMPFGNEHADLFAALASAVFVDSFRCVPHHISGPNIEPALSNSNYSAQSQDGAVKTEQSSSSTTGGTNSDMKIAAEKS